MQSLLPLTSFDAGISTSAITSIHNH